MDRQVYYDFYDRMIETDRITLRKYTVMLHWLHVDEGLFHGLNSWRGCSWYSISSTVLFDLRFL